MKSKEDVEYCYKKEMKSRAEKVSENFRSEAIRQKEAWMSKGMYEGLPKQSELPEVLKKLCHEIQQRMKKYRKQLDPTSSPSNEQCGLDDDIVKKKKKMTKLSLQPNLEKRISSKSDSSRSDTDSY